MDWLEANSLHHFDTMLWSRYGVHSLYNIVFFVNPLKENEETKDLVAFF